MKTGVWYGTALLVVTAIGGCGGGGGDQPQPVPKVALLFPGPSTLPREARDRSEFEARVADLCGPRCAVVYSSAAGSGSRQQAQAEEATAEGADVLVIDPVDSVAAAAVARMADEAEVAAIAYDRPVVRAPVDYFVSFDSVEVGELQARALAKALKQAGHARGPVVMINGPLDDPVATQVKEGANRAFSRAGVVVARSYDTPGERPARAQSEMHRAIAALGKEGFEGVYAADDGLAGGAVAAMKAAGIELAARPTTGQGAELPALHRILVDEQLMTVYRPTEPEVDAAARIAVALASGRKVPPSLIDTRVQNGHESVPAVLLNPVAVRKDNITITIVKDEFWKVSEMCTGRFKRICRRDSVD